MRQLPADRFGHEARVQANGRVAYDIGVYRVKAPAESKEAWDYYQRIATVPANIAFRPASASGCSLKAAKAQ
jgi:branched-chain amino acid transport system substrate-binding protein